MLCEVVGDCERLRVFINDKAFFNKFVAVYEKQSALFHDSADIMEIKENLEKLQNIFAEALVDASGNYRASLTVSESQPLTKVGNEFRDQQSSQETDFTQDFDYSDLNWATDIGIITGKDKAIFERTINNEIYRGVKPQSANGEYIIDTGKCLMFTDGDFHNPTLSRVIVFATEYESLTDEAKRRIIDEAESTGDVQVSQRIIENIYGPGFAVEYTPEVYRANAGQNGRGKRANSKGSNQRYRAKSLKERFAEEGLSHLLEEDAVYSSQETDLDSVEHKINTSMTMAEAKRMIETAYRVNNIAEYYEDEYTDAEDWLRKAGADEVEMYIENDFDLQARYINSNEDILNEEYRMADVLEAYLAGTLIGKEKPMPKRLDVSQSTKLQDSRFYSPQKIEDTKETYKLAIQKAVGKDANAINYARAEILLFAHNKGAAELLGITQAELNKKLRSWSNYSATARDISEKINAGVAEENRWTGIENSSYINKAKVTNEDIERLVASVEGDSKGYERKYIARVMLAADTHIDYSGLKFKFASSQQVNTDNKGGNSGGNRVLGFYDDTNRLIEVTHDKPHTVAHEMGHYIDAQWGRDLIGTNSSHLFLTRGVNEDMVRARYGEPGVQFLKNFKLFINSLSDVNQNYNSYYNDRGEIFARFFARFIEWTDNIATGNKYYSYESTMYADKFTQAQFVEFARLLQEKALLDGKVVSKAGEQYSSQETDIDTSGEVNYDNENVDEQEDKTNETRKESGEAFDRRTSQELFRVSQKGQLRYAYRPYLGTAISERAKDAEKELKKFGIPVFIYEKLETNFEGITENHEKDDSAAIPNVGVFIPFDAVVDSKEIVGHEGFHFLAESEDRANYVSVLVDNIDFPSAGFISYYNYVQEKYFKKTVAAESKESDESKDKKRSKVLSEEIFAFITGDIHAGDPKGKVHKFLRDYDAVKTAWDDLLKKQSRDALYSTQETDADADGEKVYSYEGLPADAFYNEDYSYIYGYDFLTVQKDMTIVDSLPTLQELQTDRKIDSEKVLAAGYKNILAMGGTKVGDTYSIINTYTNRPLQIGKNSITHGLGAEDINAKRTNARLAAVIGELCKNAIPICALPNTHNVRGTYGMAVLVNSRVNGKDMNMIALITVEQQNGKVQSVDFVDVAHAVSGRLVRDIEKENRSAQGTPPGTKSEWATRFSSPIKITQFLDVVNRTHQGYLSDDVISKLGEERRGLKKALYSTQETDNISNRELLANAFEGITKDSDEYKLIQEYKSRIKLLNEQEEKLSKLNAEIRKIRFGTTGARDTARLTQLEAEAKNTAKAINRHDKKLLSLEASEPLRKVIERERKKEAQKTKKHIKEIQQNKKTRAEQTELRHKIRKAIRDLDKVLNRGNKKRNVKENMQNVVSTALKAADILFTDNYGTYDMLRNGLGVDLSDSEEALVATCTKMLKDLDKMPTDGYENWQGRQKALAAYRKDAFDKQIGSIKKHLIHRIRCFCYSSV